MSFSDRMDAAGDDLKGKAKEAAGKVSGDKDTEAEGKMDQFSADVKDKTADVKEKASEFGEKAKDVAGDIGSNIKAAAEKLKEGFSSDK